MCVGEFASAVHDAAGQKLMPCEITLTNCMADGKVRMQML